MKFNLIVAAAVIIIIIIIITYLHSYILHTT